MKQKNISELKVEFSKYLEFWMRNMLSEDKDVIIPEISQHTVPNIQAEIGSMYLSRIIYGASRACHTLNTNTYKELADTAFNMLADLKNPSGGYYWARKYNMEWQHDADNINMAQAFVLWFGRIFEYKFFTGCCKACARTVGFYPGEFER